MDCKQAGVRGVCLSSSFLLVEVTRDRPQIGFLVRVALTLKVSFLVELVLSDKIGLLLEYHWCVFALF